MRTRSMPAQHEETRAPATSRLSSVLGSCRPGEAERDQQAGGKPQQFRRARRNEQLELGEDSAQAWNLVLDPEATGDVGATQVEDTVVSHVLGVSPTRALIMHRRPDVWPIVDRDAGSVVAHGQCGRSSARVAPYSEVDRTARWCELDCVGQQVGHDLGEPGRVTVDGCGLEVANHLLLVRLGERPERIGGAGSDLGEVAPFDGDVRAGERGIGFGERAEVVDQAAKPEHVIMHLDEVLHRGFGDAIDDLLAPALQKCERGPQFMGDISGEVAAAT